MDGHASTVVDNHELKGSAALSPLPLPLLPHAGFVPSSNSGPHRRGGNCARICLLGMLSCCACRFGRSLWVFHTVSPCRTTSTLVGVDFDPRGSSVACASEVRQAASTLLWARGPGDGRPEKESEGCRIEERRKTKSRRGGMTGEASSGSRSSTVAQPFSGF